jgi:hypothetical protein
MDLGLRLVRLPRVELPERRLLLLLQHLVLVHHLLVVWCHVLRPVVHVRAVNVALLHLLAQLHLRARAHARLRRAVVHGHLLERLGRVVGVEERLLRWQVDFHGRH